MKLQYLFLPALLWLLSFAFFFFVPPQSTLIVGLFILLVNCALFFSLRLKFSNKTVYTGIFTVTLLMVLTAWQGFSFLNTFLILAIGTLVSMMF